MAADDEDNEVDGDGVNDPQAAGREITKKHKSEKSPPIVPRYMRQTYDRIR